MLMRPQFQALMRLMVAPALLFALGCSQTNEENLGGQTSQVVPHKEGTPDFKTYAEAQQYQAQQAAKNRPAGKGKAAAKAGSQAAP
jgi:hypothetical protein